MLAVWAAPGARETLPKVEGFPPPHTFWNGLPGRRGRSDRQNVRFPILIKLKVPPKVQPGTCWTFCGAFRVNPWLGQVFLLRAGVPRPKKHHVCINTIFWGLCRRRRQDQQTINFMKMCGLFLGTPGLQQPLGKQKHFGIPLTV
jgi:hypothetical protein